MTNDYIHINLQSRSNSSIGPLIFDTLLCLWQILFWRATERLISAQTAHAFSAYLIEGFSVVCTVHYSTVYFTGLQLVQASTRTLLRGYVVLLNRQSYKDLDINIRIKPRLSLPPPYVIENKPHLQSLEYSTVHILFKAMYHILSRWPFTINTFKIFH